MAKPKEYVHVDDRRYCAKVRLGKTQAQADTTLYWEGYRFEHFMRWLWYFRYRAALLQVAHPRWYVELTTGSYPFRAPEEERVKALKDKIAGKRRTVTKYATQLRMAEQTWTGLFPIAEDRHYQRAVEKVARLRKELEELESTI